MTGAAPDGTNLKVPAAGASRAVCDVQRRTTCDFTTRRTIATMGDVRRPTMHRAASCSLQRAVPPLQRLQVSGGSATHAMDLVALGSLAFALFQLH